MPIFKRGQTWWIDITTPSGERIRRSAKTKVKKEAVELHDKLKAAAWDQDVLDKTPDRFFEEALLLFLKDSEGQKRLDAKRSHAVYFRKKFSGRTLRSLTSDELSASIPLLNANTGKELSNATQNRYRSTLLRILSLSMKAGWIDKIPYIPRKVEPKVRVSWITKEQASSLIESLRLQWMKNICSFALYTGARMSEILTLTWENVDFKKRIAIVTCDNAKSGRSRSLPLNKDASILLKILKAKQASKYVFVRDSTSNNINDIDRRDFKQACEKIGLPNLHFHDLRHTWASWHVQSGTPLFTLKEMGGWETLEMVKRYAHLNADHMIDHADRVTFSSQFHEQSHLKIVGRL